MRCIQFGINQLVQHDALDASREGFLEALKEKGFEEGKNLKIDYQNAQGDIAIAKTISDQFVTSKVDMIFAIATSSLQASYNATKDIPIVFTAVTDLLKQEWLKVGKVQVQMLQELQIWFLWKNN